MNKEAVVSLRLDPDTVAQLRDIANQKGVTVSDLLRKGALAVLEEPNTMRVTWTAGPNVTLLNDQTVRVDASAEDDCVDRRHSPRASERCFRLAGAGVPRSHRQGNYGSGGRGYVFARGGHVVRLAVAAEDPAQARPVLQDRRRQVQGVLIVRWSWLCWIGIHRWEAAGSRYAPIGDEIMVEYRARLCRRCGSRVTRIWGHIG